MHSKPMYAGRAMFQKIPQRSTIYDKLEPILWEY
jgi:hypothetical protein